MKKITFTLLIGLCTTLLMAQDWNNQPVKNNNVYGFAGLITEIALDPHAGVAGGVLGGVAINDFFVGGFSMAGYYNQVQLQKFSFEKSIVFGGVFTGYSLFSKEEAHLYTNLRIGKGLAMLSNAGDGVRGINEKVYVLNPEIGLEINVSSWSRFIISASYRWVSKFEQSNGLTNVDFENYAVGMTFRVGSFGSGM